MFGPSRPQQARLIQILHPFPHRKKRVSTVKSTRITQLVPSHEQTQLFLPQKHRKKLVFGL